MRGEHHELITRLAIDAVLSRVDSPVLSILRVTAGYIVRTSSSADRARGRRSHHAYPSSWIIGSLLEVRRQVLRCSTSRVLPDEQTLAELAYALHCLQDRCIPPCGREHARIEGLLGKELKDRSAAQKLLPHAYEVRSFRELKNLIYGQQPAGNPSSAAVCAFTMTYAALYAVFSRPEAPPELRNEARNFSRALRRRARLASATGFVSCALQIAVEILVEPALAFLRLLSFHIIMLVLFIEVLKIAQMRSLTEFLWRIYEGGNFVVAAHVIVAITTPILLLELLLLPVLHRLLLIASTAAIPIAAEALRALLRSERYRGLLEESPWYLWD